MQSDRATDATEDGDAPIVGVVCGLCLEGVEADRIPTFCGSCHARFDLGAPHASVHYGTFLRGVEVHFGVSARLHGETWCSIAVEHVRALVEDE